jgi:hypothetical protein
MSGHIQEKPMRFLEGMPRPTSWRPMRRGTIFCANIKDSGGKGETIGVETMGVEYVDWVIYIF